MKKSTVGDGKSRVKAAKANVPPPSKGPGGRDDGAQAVSKPSSRQSSAAKGSTDRPSSSSSKPSSATKKGVPTGKAGSASDGRPASGAKKETKAKLSLFEQRRLRIAERNEKGDDTKDAASAERPPSASQKDKPAKMSVFEMRRARLAEKKAKEEEAGDTKPSDRPSSTAKKDRPETVSASATNKDKPTKVSAMDLARSHRNKEENKESAKERSVVMDHAMSSTIDKAITNGSFNCELPLTNKIVRIFTSSTFTDTKVERNALMEEVYPKLKVYCQERGYEFQVVDMRWGVRDEATDDHMTSELCMREIRECQKFSTGPNFITFLAQKYGYRPFPPKIDAAEFESILSGIKKPEDKKLLSDWFLKDDNSVPPKYCLQPIRNKLPDYANDENPSGKEKARKLWWEAFEKMQSILRHAASVALSDKTQINKYYWSVTEEEIQIGLLGSTDPSTSCYWFQRNISDLERNKESKMAGRFMDISGAKVDDEALNLISKLKNDSVSGKLPSNNVTKYTVKWTENGIDPAVSKEHSTYIKKFTEDFQSVLTGMIDQGIQKRQQEEITDTLLVECIQHLQFAKTKSQLFMGRDVYLKKVTEIVKTSNNGKPIIFCGQPGCGKTTLMAKIVEQVPHTLGQDTPVVARFIGTTSQSSGTRELLQSLCQQIAKLTGKTDNVPKDLKTLKETFLAAVTKESNQKLVVLLDSLDQLRDFGADIQDWIPPKPSSNVTLIMSAIPDEEFRIVPELKQYLPAECFLDVPLLSKNEVETILQSALQKAQRTLQKSQMEIVRTACERCSLPLHMKIALDNAISWRSYTPRDNLVIASTVNQIIDVLFERIEKYHGQVLVSRALGYITAARSGLSVNELEDVLSCDDVALNDVYQYHMPPLRRLPPLLWVRIQADLQEYLTNSGADGIQVTRWYHRQFHSVATQRYLKPAQKRKDLHKSLSEYFLGIWTGGIEKPYTDKKGKTLAAKRFPAQQPLIFKESVSGRREETVFNLRKMNELPYHLVKSGQVEELKTKVLCCFEWLYEKSRALGVESILDDFELAKEDGSFDGEIKAVYDSLICGKDSIVFDIKLLPCQLVARLATDDISSKPFIQKLLDQAKRPHFDCLLTSQGFLSDEGEPSLKRKFVGHTAPIACFAANDSSTKLVSVSEDQTIRIWDMNSGRQLVCLTVEKGTPHHPGFLDGVRFCNKDNCVVTFQHTTRIMLWDIQSKSLIWDDAIKYQSRRINRVVFHVDNIGDRAITANNADLEVWDLKVKKKLYEFEPEKYIQGDDRRDFLGGVAADIIFHRGGSHKVHFFNIDKYQKKKSLTSIDMLKRDEGETAITRFAVTPSGIAACHYHYAVPMDKLDAFSRTPAFVKTFDIKSGKILKTIEGLDAGFSPGLTVLVPAGHKSVVFTPLILMNTVLNVIDLEAGTFKDTLSYNETLKHTMYSGRPNEVLISFIADPTVIEHLAMNKEMKPPMELKAEVGGNILGPICHSKRFISYSNGLGYRNDIWDLVKRAPVRQAEGMGGGMSWISPELLVVSKPPTGIYVYNMKEGKQIVWLDGESQGSWDQGQRSAPSEDGNVYVLGPKYNQISLYDIKKGKYEYSLSGDKQDRFYGFRVSESKTVAIAFLLHKLDEKNRLVFPDGKTNFSDRLVVFNLKGKKRLPDIKCQTSRALAQASVGFMSQDMSHDGQHFIAAISLRNEGKNNESDLVHVWETQTGKSRTVPVRMRPDDRFPDEPRHIKLSKASNCIVIAYSSGHIVLWDMAKLSVKHQITTLDQLPRNIWLSPDQHYAMQMSCDYSNRLHLLDLVKGKLLMTFRIDKDIGYCSFSEDNQFLLMSMAGVKNIVQLYWYRYAEWKDKIKSLQAGQSPEDMVGKNLAQQERSTYGEFQEFDFVPKE